MDMESVDVDDVGIERELELAFHNTDARSLTPLAMRINRNSGFKQLFEPHISYCLNFYIMFVCHSLCVVFFSRLKTSDVCCDQLVYI